MDFLSGLFGFEDNPAEAEPAYKDAKHAAGAFAPDPRIHKTPGRIGEDLKVPADMQNSNWVKFSVKDATGKEVVFEWDPVAKGYGQPGVLPENTKVEIKNLTSLDGSRFNGCFGYTSGMDAQGMYIVKLIPSAMHPHGAWFTCRSKNLRAVGDYHQKKATAAQKQIFVKAEVPNAEAVQQILTKLTEGKLPARPGVADRVRGRDPTPPAVRGVANNTRANPIPQPQREEARPPPTEPGLGTAQFGVATESNKQKPVERMSSGEQLDMPKLEIPKNAPVKLTTSAAAALGERSARGAPPASGRGMPLGSGRGMSPGSGRVAHMTAPPPASGSSVEGGIQIPSATIVQHVREGPQPAAPGHGGLVIGQQQVVPQTEKVVVSQQRPATMSPRAVQTEKNIGGGAAMAEQLRQFEQQQLQQQAPPMASGRSQRSRSPVDVEGPPPEIKAPPLSGFDIKAGLQEQGHYSARASPSDQNKKNNSRSQTLHERARATTETAVSKAVPADPEGSGRRGSSRGQAPGSGQALFNIKAMKIPKVRPASMPFTDSNLTAQQQRAASAGVVPSSMVMLPGSSGQIYMGGGGAPPGSGRGMPPGSAGQMMMPPGSARGMVPPGSGRQQVHPQSGRGTMPGSNQTLPPGSMTSVKGGQYRVVEQKSGRSETVPARAPVPSNLTSSAGKAMFQRNDHPGELVLAHHPASGHLHHQGPHPTGSSSPLSPATQVYGGRPMPPGTSPAATSQATAVRAGAGHALATPPEASKKAGSPGIEAEQNKKRGVSAPAPPNTAPTNKSGNDLSKLSDEQLRARREELLRSIGKANP